MTKRKPKQYRDERGRFAAPAVDPATEWGTALEFKYGEHRLERPAEVVRIISVSGPIDTTRITCDSPPYCDEIYRPKKIGWLERIIRFWMWRHA